MHTITLNINNDTLFDKIFSFLQRFQDDGLEIISKNDKNADQIIRQYIKGYEKYPENIDEIEAWQKASFDVFSKGEW